MIHLISSVIQNTVIITSFVMVMMLLIEYINVGSKGQWIHHLQGAGYKQVFICALLGLVPGCLGGFAVVSLFTHNIINFGALMACLIATVGDEAFVMLTIIPKTALLIDVILFVIAVATGIIINVCIKKFPTPYDSGHYAIHKSDTMHNTNVRGNWRANLKNISFERALLLTGIIALIVFILLGWADHDHDHGGEHHHHGDFTNILLQEHWLNILFVAACAMAVVIITIVNDHFLKEHLWQHIIKGHLPKIFLWTTGILLVIGIGEQLIDLDMWVRNHHIYILALAVLIGLIPESGPHMIFIALFAEGTIPLSVLLTNSIVQEGHAGLPLLAESKKGFVWMKLISVAIGLIIGLIGFVFGF